MIPPKLSATDWKNLEDSGGLAIAFLYAVCYAMAYQATENWFVAIGLAAVFLVVGGLALMLSLLVWALPWLIVDGIGNAWRWLGDRVFTPMRNRRTAHRRVVRRDR